MACSARARRACYHHSTDSTLNCMGMQRTARGPLRVPPSLNTDSTSCEAPRGTCSHPAPSRHAHPTLPLVPLPASSVYICALLYTWLHASGDPCSPSTGCCLALPTQAAQPVPRGTCSHSAPSLSASLEDTLDPACSVISALLYPPMRTPSHSQAAVVPRPRSAHAVTCALAQAFSASLLVVRFDHPWQWLWRWNLCWLVHE